MSNNTQAKVLVIAEHLDGKLNASTAKTVSAAAAVNADAIDVVVLAADPTAVAAEAAQIAGVAKVLTVANTANANAIAQVLAPQIAELAAGYTHVFAPSTTFGKDLLPCVAALLGVNQVSDLMAVEGPHTFKRPIYAGNAIITVETPADQTVVATVRAASWPEAAKGGSATVEAVSVDATLPTHTRYIGLAAGKSDRPDLQSAGRVVSGGRGVGSAENFKIVYDLARNKAIVVDAVLRTYDRSRDDLPIYTRAATYEALKKVLEEKLHEYNETNAVMDLVLFQQAMEHVTRISRIIDLPRFGAWLLACMSLCWRSACLPACQA